MRFLNLCLVAILLLAIGCAQQSDQAAEESHEATTPAPAEEATGHETGGEAVVATTVSVGDEVTLSGTAGCGHCNFQKGDSCAMAMQVADGTIFILDGIEEDTEAFNQRTKGLQISVVGTVTDTGDPHHLDVESYEM